MDMPTEMGRILKKPQAVQEALEKLAGDCPSSIDCQLACQVHAGLRLPEHWFNSAVGALVTNAVESVSTPGGRIRIEVNDVALTAPQSLRFGQLQPGRYLTVSVCDNGPGLTPEALKKGVTPGYTSKTHHAGMGLSTAYGIAVSLQGGLDLMNLPGGGAVATLYLKAND